MERETPSEARLRHQLDVQSQQINRVLNHHRVPATVVGGTVRPRVVSFDLQSQIAAGLERIRGLKGDLISALGVGDVALTQNDGRWHLQVSRPDDPPVPLLKLIDSVADLPPCTAAVGLADGGHPVLLRFANQRLNHILIAGDSGAGKTCLLRTIAAGLALTNRQADLQLQVVDPQWEEGSRLAASDSPLLPLGYLPHMLTDPAFGLESSSAIIHFLAEEMAYRREAKIKTPGIFVLIDHALTLLEFGEPAAKSDLLRLLQYGAQAGIRLILATDHPGSPLLDATIKSCLSMRIIGRTADPAAARRAAGLQLDQAPLLYGEGDFLAVAGDKTTYFQAAYLGDYDLHQKLTEMARAARPRLLARPYSNRPRVAGGGNKKQAAAPVSFSIRDGAIDLAPRSIEIEPDDPDAIPF